MFRLFSYLLDIVRRRLVDVVVEPVGVEQLCVRSPGDPRLLRRVVVREIVHGDDGIHAALAVTLVLELESVGVVLRIGRR